MLPRDSEISLSLKIGETKVSVVHAAPVSAMTLMRHQPQPLIAAYSLFGRPQPALGCKSLGAHCPFEMSNSLLMFWGPQVPHH